MHGNRCYAFLLIGNGTYYKVQIYVVRDVFAWSLMGSVFVIVLMASGS